MSERYEHPHSGIQLPTEVFADPGRRGWYFREKMPDSVAHYVRADLHDTLAARVVELEDALRFYAEGAWYERGGVQFMDHSEGAPPFANSDRGQRARATLGLDESHAREV